MLHDYNHPLRLSADPSRVVVRPFHLAWQSNGAEPGRAQRLVTAVLEMSSEETRRQLADVLSDFEARHWQTRRVFMTRYDQLRDGLDETGGAGERRRGGGGRHAERGGGGADGRRRRRRGRRQRR